jgi:protein-arginine kinase activator protein McsA
MGSGPDYKKSKWTPKRKNSSDKKHVRDFLEIIRTVSGFTFGHMGSGPDHKKPKWTPKKKIAQAKNMFEIF